MLYLLKLAHPKGHYKNSIRHRISSNILSCHFEHRHYPAGTSNGLLKSPVWKRLTRGRSERMRSMGRPNAPPAARRLVRGLAWQRAARTACLAFGQWRSGRRASLSAGRHLNRPTRVRQHFSLTIQRKATFSAIYSSLFMLQSASITKMVQCPWKYKWLRRNVDNQRSRAVSFTRSKSVKESESTDALPNLLVSRFQRL